MITQLGIILICLKFAHGFSLIYLRSYRNLRIGVVVVPVQILIMEREREVGKKINKKRLYSKYLSQ